MKGSDHKCKPLAKFHHKGGGHPRLASIKGSMVAWSGDRLSFYNTSFIDTSQHQPPIELEFDNATDGSVPHIANHRLQGAGNLIVVGSGVDLRIYEVMSSYNPRGDDWFGSVRFIVIILAIGLVIGYNVYNRR
jgi:hypothetical protein